MRLRLLVLAVPVLVLAGCGGSTRKTSRTASNGLAVKSATEIIAAATAAANSATAVHVSGSGIDNGVPLVFDLSLVARKGGKGHLSEQGLSFQLIRVGNSVYLKGSPAFYRRFAGPSAAQLFKDKWLKGPATTGDFSSLTSLTDLHKFVNRSLGNHGTLAKTTTSVVHGQRVVGIKDTSKGGILYVAAVGKPYPVEITKGGSDKGTLLFDRWNQPVTLTAPPNAVDISKLKG